MACECQKNRIVYPFGNDVLMRLFLYEGQPRAEFTVDGYDSWSVRILRDGCITAKGIESGLDENNRIVIHLPNTLPVGIYTMELSIIKNHMERRSMMCGVIEVVTCDQYANIPTGVVVGTTQTDMDIYFEITESVWEQGMSSYDYWKIDHPDGTLQEYLDTLLPVQSDWTQTDNTLPDFIKNKPNVYSISSRDIDTMGAVTGLFLITDSSRGGIIISSGLFNYAEQVWIDVEHGYIKTRMMNLGVWGAWSDPIYQPMLISGTNIKTINNQSLLGSGNIDIQGGGEQEQADWNVTNSSLPSYIKHKPNVKEINELDINNMTEAGGLFIVTRGAGGIICTIGRNQGYAEQVWLDAEHGYIKTREMSRGAWSAWSDAAYYIKPSSGIPKSDLASAVQTSLGKADTAYQKPSSGIPKSAFVTSVQTSLGLADSALQSQEQADWNETDNTAPSFIKNKPTIPDVSNFVEKSQTSGLLRNDGTVDTNHYLVNAPVTSVNGQTGAVSLNIPSAQVNSDWNASSGVAAILNKPTIPDVSNLAEKVVVVDASTMPSTLDPNKVYQFGTLTGSVTIPPFASVPSGDNEAKIWCFTFETGTTAPTITWSAGITNWVGGSAPTINASKKYEVSVMDGIGAILEA